MRNLQLTVCDWTGNRVEPGLVEEEFLFFSSPAPSPSPFILDVFAFSVQIKDMALKASGAYRHCKPCSGSSAGQQGNYADSDAASFHCSYRRTGSSSSTPQVFGKEIIKGISSGDTTPASMSGRTEMGSARARATVVFMEENVPKEWVAQVEPGVLITFVALPQGGNDLKRIRFR